MKLKAALIAFVMLACVPLTPAQTVDPVSGAWSGQLGNNEIGWFKIKMNLKFDGKLISGTLTGLDQPGEVKTGSFDFKTGALHLEASPTGSPNTGLAFDGTLVSGTATGRVSGDGKSGIFVFTRADSVATQVPGDTAEALRKSFDEVSTWISKAADMVPAEKYSYKPVPTVRSFGEIIAHVADSYNYYCAHGKGSDLKWSDPIEKGIIDKASLAVKLKESLDGCKSVYATPVQVAPLIENVGHTNLHYGNVITYMRILGLKPPSS